MTVGKAGKSLTGSVGPAIHPLSFKIHEPDEEGNGEVKTELINVGKL